MPRTNIFSIDAEPDCDESDKYPTRSRFNHNCPDQDCSPCGSCYSCEEEEEEEEEEEDRDG